MTAFNCSDNNEHDNYYQFVNKAKEAASNSNLEEAIAHYENAFATLNGKGRIEDKFETACIYAQLDNIDKSFSFLFNLEKKAKFKDLQFLTSEKRLNRLHNDIRWKNLVSLVKNNKESYEKDLNPVLVKRIDSMAAVDQKYRVALRSHSNDSGKLQIKELKTKIKEIDSLNYIELEKIVSQFGFLTKKQLGNRASNNFWLLIQHQDKHINFQNHMLKLMAPLLDSNLVYKSNFAYLYDRVQINNDSLQLFGTQLRLNSDSTSYETFDVFNIDSLDERRKSYNLSPISQYIKRMNTVNEKRLKINSK